MALNVKEISSWKIVPELLTYFGVFLFFLLTFFVLYLPEEKIQQRLADELEYHTLGKAAFEMLKLKPFFSFRVNVFTYKVKNSEGETVPISFKNIKGKLTWYRLLIGQIQIVSSGEFAKGTVKIKAVLRKDDDAWDIWVKGDTLSLEILRKFNKTVAVEGSVDIEGQAELTQGKFVTASVDIKSQEASVAAMKIRDFSIPDIDLETLTGHLSLKNKTLSISNLELKGPDLNIIAEGEINIRKPFEKSKLDLTTKAYLSPNFLTKFNLTMLSGLLVSQKDKWLTIPIKGTVKSPKADFKSMMQKAAFPNS